MPGVYGGSREKLPGRRISHPSEIPRQHGPRPQEWVRDVVLPHLHKAVQREHTPRGAVQQETLSEHLVPLKDGQVQLRLPRLRERLVRSNETP